MLVGYFGNTGKSGKTVVSGVGDGSYIEGRGTCARVSSFMAGDLFLAGDSSCILAGDGYSFFLQTGRSITSSFLQSVVGILSSIRFRFSKPYGGLGVRAPNCSYIGGISK